MNAPNVIVLDLDPKTCAQCYVDVDVQTKADEYANLLYAANMIANGGAVTSRHILTKWAQGADAFWWLVQLTRSVLDEQERRFNEIDDDAYNILSAIVGVEYSAPRVTTPRFVQLVDKKIPGKPVTAYREWYHHAVEKPSWTNQNPPDWWFGSVQTALLF